MVSPKVVAIVTIVIKVLSIAGGFAAYANNLPGIWQAIAVGAFAIGSSLKDILLVIGDFFDDGVINKSFKGE